MTDPESLMGLLGIDPAETAVPDSLWTRALDNALSPTAPTVDESLVPEMTDTPEVPDGDDELIYDSSDADDPAGDSDTDDASGLMDAADDLPGPAEWDGTNEADISFPEVTGDSSHTESPDLGDATF